MVTPMQPTYLPIHSHLFRRQFPTLVLGDHTRPAEQAAVGSNVFRLLDCLFVDMYIPDWVIRVAMKIHKMVSLDQETARMASQMTNFSGWVRRMLHLRDRGDDTVAVYRNLTALMAAVSDHPDEEIQREIFEQYNINREQKRLGEFE